MPLMVSGKTYQEYDTTLTKLQFEKEKDKIREVERVWIKMDRQRNR